MANRSRRRKDRKSSTGEVGVRDRRGRGRASFSDGAGGTGFRSRRPPRSTNRDVGPYCYYALDLRNLDGYDIGEKGFPLEGAQKEANCFVESHHREILYAYPINYEKAGKKGGLLFEKGRVEKGPGRAILGQANGQHLPVGKERRIAASG